MAPLTSVETRGRNTPRDASRKPGPLASLPGAGPGVPHRPRGESNRPTSRERRRAADADLAVMERGGSRRWRPGLEQTGPERNGCGGHGEPTPDQGVETASPGVPSPGSGLSRARPPPMLSRPGAGVNGLRAGAVSSRPCRGKGDWLAESRGTCLSPFLRHYTAGATQGGRAPAAYARSQSLCPARSQNETALACARHAWDRLHAAVTGSPAQDDGGSRVRLLPQQDDMARSADGLCLAGTYALALLGELADFAVRHPGAVVLTIGLTALAWAVQTAYLANLAWPGIPCP